MIQMIKLKTMGWKFFLFGVLILFMTNFVITKCDNRGANIIQGLNNRDIREDNNCLFLVKICCISSLSVPSIAAVLVLIIFSIESGQNPIQILLYTICGSIYLCLLAKFCLCVLSHPNDGRSRNIIRRAHAEYVRTTALAESVQTPAQVGTIEEQQQV